MIDCGSIFLWTTIIYILMWFLNVTCSIDLWLYDIICIYIYIYTYIYIYIYTTTAPSICMWTLGWTPWLRTAIETAADLKAGPLGGISYLVTAGYLTWHLLFWVSGQVQWICSSSDLLVECFTSALPQMNDDVAWECKKMSMVGYVWAICIEIFLQLLKDAPQVLLAVYPHYGGLNSKRELPMFHGWITNGDHGEISS